MMANVEFGILIVGGKATDDEIGYASSRAVNKFIRQNSNEDSIIEKVINGLTKKFEILTFNVELIPDFLDSRKDKNTYVDFSMRIFVHDTKFASAEVLVDSIEKSVGETLANDLSIPAENIERLSQSMSGGVGLNEVDLYKPNGNHWFRDPYQWTTNESNEVAVRVGNGENESDVVGEINARKNNIMGLNMHYVYDTAYNRHKKKSLVLKSKVDGSSLSSSSLNNDGEKNKETLLGRNFFNLFK